jgi:MFS family permease
VTANASEPLSDVRRLSAAEILSGAGDGIFWVALVIKLADEPRFSLLLLLAVLARLGPRALLSIAAGGLIERVDLRHLLVTIDLIRCATMITLALLSASGGSPTPLLVCVLVSYVVGVPTRPALSLALLEISGENRLASATATISTLRQLMTFVGPLLGVAVAVSSPSIAFLLNGVSFAASAVLISSIRGLRTMRPARRKPSTDSVEAPNRWLVGSFVDGFDAIQRVQGLGGLVLLVGAMYFVRGTEMVLHVLIVRDLLHDDPSAIGYLAGAVGLGAVVAMPIASRAANSGHPVRPVVASVALTAGPIAVVAFVGHLVTAAALLALVGVGMVLFEVVSVVTAQRTIAAPDLGRAFGAINSASNTGKLAGAIAAPGLVAIFNTSGALVFVAVSLAVVSAATFGAMTKIGRAAVARRTVLDPITDVLASLALFDGAPRSALEQLASVVEPCEVSAGTVLILEGDEPDDLFIVRVGLFDVLIGGHMINTLGPESWFGEIGLVRRTPRMATVRASTDATVWRIPGRTFLDVLEVSGAAPSALVQGIADRLAMVRAEQAAA